MIRRIRGELIARDSGTVEVLAGDGLAYELSVPMGLADRLPPEPFRRDGRSSGANGEAPQSGVAIAAPDFFLRCAIGLRRGQIGRNRERLKLATHPSPFLRRGREAGTFTLWSITRSFFTIVRSRRPFQIGL